MSLHGLTSITLGVPDVDAVASYYEDFGLRRVGDRPGRGLVFATADGGEQLELRLAERRRLLEIWIGADDPDDPAWPVPTPPWSCPATGWTGRSSWSR